MNNYLIEGDSFSIKNKIDEIITNNNFKDSITSTYSLEEQSLEKPLEDLDTYSLLSNKKTIIINNIELIKKDESQNNIDHLLKYLDNPSNDNLLIITANKIDSKSTILKKIKEKTTYIKPEYKSEDIIKNYLKDYKISNVDINYLIELCNDNQINNQNRNRYEKNSIDFSSSDMHDRCIGSKVLGRFASRQIIYVWCSCRTQCWKTERFG